MEYWEHASETAPRFKLILEQMWLYEKHTLKCKFLVIHALGNSKQFVQYDYAEFAVYSDTLHYVNDIGFTFDDVVRAKLLPPFIRLKAGHTPMVVQPEKIDFRRFV